MSALASDRIAILPVIYPKDYRHFLVALKAPTKGPLLVDVLGSVRGLMEGLHDGRGRWYRGAALFVESGDATERGASAPPKRLVFQPAELDFGKIILGPKQASVLLRKEFSVRNASAKPIVVRDVAVSCGCIQKLSWKGGTLEPGEKREVSFEIVPGAWGKGAGQEERALFFTVVDGAVHEFCVKGELVLPEAKHTLKVIPETIRVNIDSAKGANEIVREATVFYEAQTKSTPRVAAASSWVSAAIEPLEPHSARLVVRIAPTRQTFASSCEAEGYVDVKVGLARARLTVLAFREKYYRVSRDFLTLSRAQKIGTKVNITPRESAGNLSVLKAWPDNSALEVSSEELAGGTVGLTIRPTSAAHGLYRVFCRLKSSSRPEMLATIVVQVAP